MTPFDTPENLGALLIPKLASCLVYINIHMHNNIYIYTYKLYIYIYISWPCKSMPQKVNKNSNMDPGSTTHQLRIPGRSLETDFKSPIFPRSDD